MGEQRALRDSRPLPRFRPNQALRLSFVRRFTLDEWSFGWRLRMLLENIRCIRNLLLRLVSWLLRAPLMRVQTTG